MHYDANITNPPRDKIPRNKQATYVQIVCAIRLHKTEKYCVRLTAGGNLVNYNGEKSTPVASLETIKIH